MPQSPKFRWKKLLTGQLPLEQETAWFVLASALDVLMTAYMLTHPTQSFVEANPVARWFIYGWGLKGMVAFKFSLVAFVCILAQAIATQKRETAETLLRCATILVAGVVAYSVVLYFKHSG